jgi:hypothetical protein
MDVYDGLDEYIESPKLRTRVAVAHGLKLDGSRQTVDGMEIYPIDFFCPKNFKTGIVQITSNTKSIHHFDASWYPKSGRKYMHLMRFLNLLLGEKRGDVAFGKIIEFKDRIMGKKE